MGLAYGACDSPSDGTPKRITYVISPDQRVEKAILTKDPAGQAEALLAAMTSK